MPNVAKHCECKSKCHCHGGIVRGADGKWTWPGQRFSERPTIRRFAECNRLLTPTIILGHEEDDDEEKFWASVSTGVPSVGIVTRLWRDGDFLLGDFGDLLPIAQKAIDTKAYRKVSAEIYDNFEDQGVDYGMALRRLALLGGEIPQVKALADLPMTSADGTAKGVEIFAVGTHPTKDGPKHYSRADLDQIVANFERLSTCGVPVKMSELVHRVFHEARRQAHKVFRGPNGKWFWDGCIRI